MKEDTFPTIRTGQSRTATNALKQSRRFEQVAYRIELIAKDKDNDDSRRRKHVQLNVEAIRAIRRDLKWADTWQRKLPGQRYQIEKDAANIYKKGWMSLNAQHSAKLYEEHKAEAIA